jgi:hypothetical protein
LFVTLAFIVVVALFVLIASLFIGAIESASKRPGLKRLAEGGQAVVKGKVVGFFERNSSVFGNALFYAVVSIYYAWITAACIGALVIAIYYRSTLLDIWHVWFPSPPPALAVSSNTPCTKTADGRANASP